jgi:hypothetical protein
MRIRTRKGIANFISMFVALALSVALAVPAPADNDKTKEQLHTPKG